MDIFFIEYRDPLFSVIVFFVIIFIITFFSYWWGSYKRKEDYKHLNKFLRQFRSLPSENEIKVLVANGGLSDKLWFLLANSYSKSGDYEKAIEIYNEMLQKGERANSKEILFLLGKTYFKAGFLERSKQIFLEILKYNPRTPQALHYLLLVYEYMRDYKSALEVLEPLDELDEDVVLESSYLQALILINDTKIDREEQKKRLLAIYKQKHTLTYMIFEYLFRVDKEFAWNHYDTSHSEILTDIFWNLDLKDLNLDIISKNSYLRELYTAKGYLNLAEESSVFEFDILIKLQAKANATLSFEYVCESCKGVYPFAFHRCSVCHEIDTQRLEWSLTRDYIKDFSEENNSFQ
jgi:pentatricopeptide repeat protein